MRKIFKVSAIVIVSVILGIGALAILFVNVSPQFGGKHDKADLERYRQSGHYKSGKFINLTATSMDMGWKDGLRIAFEFLKGGKGLRPQFELPVEKCDSLSLTKNSSDPKLLWFGHSAFLLQLGGKNILVDPMLGNVPSPHPWLGKARFNEELPIDISALPPIDAVLISHDHYDHLDYESIIKLKEKTRMFYAPLGVGAHLEAWGVPAGKIKELNWWEELSHENIQLVFTPSRHFSGRGMTDRWSTLWGSWVIQGETKSIYFSGDGGYGDHFKEIGKRYGPFDFALMECGQYNELWHDIHMMPEETVQASIDVQANIFMPVHWGSFTLALHTWTDPVERVTQEARRLDMPVVVPRIGEIVELDTVLVKRDEWWVDSGNEEIHVAQ